MPDIQTYIWQIGEGARTAIIGHNGEWHVLMACDTFTTLQDASRRLAEIESHFETGQPDQPCWVLELIDAARLAQPYIDATAPTGIVNRFDAALRKGLQHEHGQ